MTMHQATVQSNFSTTELDSDIDQKMQSKLSAAHNATLMNGLHDAKWHVVSFAEAEDKLLQIAAHGLVGLSSTASWTKSFSQHCPLQIVVAILESHGQAVIALPLELDTQKGCVIARYVGGSHANANFPACDPHWLKEQSNIAPEILHLLKAALHASPYKIDALILERQLATMGIYENPLVASDAIQSPNVALSFATTCTFAELLAARNGKRKSKKNRSQMRKFIDAGGFEFKRPTDPVEIRAAFDVFLKMKARQFVEAGIENVFAPDGISQSIGELYAQSTVEDAHHMVVDCLYVNGDLRAICGSSIHQNTITVHVAGFCNDELASTSPGDFLSFWMVEQACNGDIKEFDLGVGDEPYKRSWCDIETFHRDTSIAITPKGSILKLLLMGKVKITSAIKSNASIWRVVKALRRKL